MQKDIIYIDTDDEITTIIDKVRSSKGKIVALVLPKRAAVLQSVVNMKLLKRSTETAKKHLVLITNEAGLLPLAGAVGVHVAASLQSRPSIPEIAAGADTPDTVDDGDFDPQKLGNKSVGELAGTAALAGAANGVEPETIELDNSTSAAGSGNYSGGKSGIDAGTAGSAAGKAAKTGKDKKLKVPNFNRFRLLLVIGALALISLLVFLYFALFVLPKAVITIETDSSDITTNASVRLVPGTTELDEEKGVLPARIQQKQQTGSQQVPATGQKNIGEKARGEITIINCNAGEDLLIPAGTGVSSNGMTFVTQEAASMEGESEKCESRSYNTAKVKVVAINPGSQYNIGATTFAVAGYGADEVKATSSDSFTGGTDNIVKIVTESDIENARQKITAGDSASVTAELKSKLEANGYVPVVSSLHTGEPVITPNAKPGDQVETVSVSQTTAYSMYGVKKSDLRQFILSKVEDKIDPKRQKVLNDGVSRATFDIAKTEPSGPLAANVSVTSLAGPELDPQAIKTAIKGKKTNDVRTQLKATPGVTEVRVKYSPFWVSKVPNKEDKITIVIDKADASTTNGGNR